MSNLYLQNLIELIEKIIKRYKFTQIPHFHLFYSQYNKSLHFFFKNKLIPEIEKKFGSIINKQFIFSIKQISCFLNSVFIPNVIPSSLNSKKKKLFHNDPHLFEDSRKFFHRIDKYIFNFEFKEHDLLFQFHTINSESEISGINKDRRYFILSNEKSVGYDNENEIFTVNFDFRKLSYNEKQKYRSNYQKNINREILSCITLFLNKIQKSKVNLNKISSNLSIFTTKHYSNIFIYPQITTFFQSQIELYEKNILIPELINNFEELNLQSISDISNFVKKFHEINQIIKEKILTYEKIKKIFFEKKKFVIRTDYHIPLQFITKSYYSMILENQNQINDWIRNIGLDPSIISKDFLKENQNLYINTQNYEISFRNQIITNIQDFFKLIQGIIIKAENWQALNLIYKNYFEKINLIYIDPPYNTGCSNFIYNDKFLKANWLTMMKNRVEIAYQLLNSRGIFFSSIDDNQLAEFSLMIEEIFKYRLDNIVWHKKTQPSYLSKELISVTEYIISAKKNPEILNLMGSYGDINKLTELINISNSISSRILKKENILIKNGWNGILKKGFYGKDKLQVELLNSSIKVVDGIPDKDLKLNSRFKWLQQKIDEEVNKGGTIHIKSTKSLRPTIARVYSEPIIKAPTTLLSKKINNIPTNTDANLELKNFFQISPFDYSKPTELIKYLINSYSYYHKNSIILDFFAGSGTTAQAVLSLNANDKGNRKYILVEQENYYDQILIPRINKLMYSSEWKDGKPISEKKFAHIAKSLVLETYEDCFRNIQIKSEKNKDENNFKKGKIIRYEVDYSNVTSPISLNPKIFETPFDYYINTSINNRNSVQKIDLVETFNFLIGLECNSSQNIIENGRDYHILIGDTNSIKDKRKEKKNTLIIWRNTKNLDIITEKEFILRNFLIHGSFDKIFFNAISSIDNSLLIEPLFHRLMFDNIFS